MPQEKEFKVRFKTRLESADMVYDALFPFLNQKSYTAKEHDGLIEIYVPTVDILGFEGVEIVRFSKKVFDRFFMVVLS